MATRSAHLGAAGKPVFLDKIAQIKTPGWKWPGVGGCSPWKVPWPPAGSGMRPGDLASSGDKTTGAGATGLPYAEEGGLGRQNPGALVKSTKSTGRRVGGGRCPWGPPGRGSLSSGKSAPVPSFGEPPADPPAGRAAGEQQCGGRREGPGTEVARREMCRGWRAASWRVRRGPVQTPAPCDLDMGLRSAPGASLSSPVKWGQRHLPGRDRTRAQSAIQA